jgi:hypothetical protein
MPLIEEIPSVVKTVVELAPALKNIQLIRGLIIPLSKVPSNETEALEKLQADANKKKEERRKLKKKQNKRVIKVSDAMECVEKYAYDGKIALDFGKALISVITSGITGTQTDLGDIMFGRMSGCMIGKALQQNNKRRSGEFKKKKPEAFSEKIRLRKGKLHPYVTP